MNRRSYLGLLGGGGATLAGIIAVNNRENNSQPGYLGSDLIVDEHDHLELRSLQQTIGVGDTIKFEVTNKSDSKTGLGCKNPWAIQQYSNGNWRHVTWTSARYYQQCLTVLSPGATLTDSIEFSKSGLESQANEVHVDLHPGRYRLLILGSSPILATDFNVVDSE